MARLLSLNVELPRDIRWQGRTVHTGISKEPVQDRRMAPRLNVDGDGQGIWQGTAANTALFCVSNQIEAYRYWQSQLGRSDFTHGEFGENVTVEGLSDDECVSSIVTVSVARCSR